MVAGISRPATAIALSKAPRPTRSSFTLCFIGRSSVSPLQADARSPHATEDYAGWFSERSSKRIRAAGDGIRIQKVVEVHRQLRSEPARQIEPFANREI